MRPWPACSTGETHRVGGILNSSHLSRPRPLPLPLSCCGVLSSIRRWHAVSTANPLSVSAAIRAGWCDTRGCPLRWEAEASEGGHLRVPDVWTHVDDVSLHARANRLMPTALLRPCATPGCPELTTGGPCPTHARQREQHRGSAASRGYDHGWLRFRRWVRHRMIHLGIAPVCGSSLPGGPTMAHSACRADGRLTFQSADGTDLHLDHDPPLRGEERKDPRAVCNPTRVTFLCRACHSAKTLKELVARTRA